MSNIIYFSDEYDKQQHQEWMYKVTPEIIERQKKQLALRDYEMTTGKLVAAKEAIARYGEFAYMNFKRLFSIEKYRIGDNWVSFKNNEELLDWAENYPLRMR